LPPARGGKHPALVGFVAGMAVVVLIGSLVYLAVRDSGAGGMTAPAGGGGTAEQPHPEASSLPADVRRNLEQLEAAAAAAPNDLLARKRLALARLDAGLYFEAFSDAEAILASRPEDPDGLFIQGVVSLSMGRAAESLELLDRVLVRYPQHLQAMIYRGLALARTSEMGQATATWEMALEMAGGSHPDIEMLLEQARSQPPPMATPPPAPAATPPPTSAPAATAVDSASSYRVTVELAPGRTAPPSTVLFVFLRPGESGPPVAVKRIPAPRLPIELVLSSEDAMMGAASLPAEGFLVARLSTTGNVSARSPDDLETSASAAIGQSVTLTLGGS
jgi:cytochrome c-type biogenesis protein CcmH